MHLRRFSWASVWSKEKGSLAAVDYHEAIKWYKLAAEAGKASGQYSLGAMYMRGKGVAVDQREGIKWIKLAAESGKFILIILSMN
jgi:TPR repeat protein